MDTYVGTLIVGTLIVGDNLGEFERHLKSSNWNIENSNVQLKSSNCEYSVKKSRLGEDRKALLEACQDDALLAFMGRSPEQPEALNP